MCAMSVFIKKPQYAVQGLFGAHGHSEPEIGEVGVWRLVEPAGGAAEFGIIEVAAAAHHVGRAGRPGPVGSVIFAFARESAYQSLHHSQTLPCTS